MKHNPFTHPEFIDRGREVENLQRIYVMNVEKGISRDFAKDISQNALKTVLEKETRPEGTQFEMALDQSIEQAQNFFGRMDLRVPTEVDFIDAGVDFLDLNALYEDMLVDGSEPMIIIAPHNLQKELWKNLYFNLSEDVSIRNNPLRRGSQQHIFEWDFNDEEAWDGATSIPKTNGVELHKVSVVEPRISLDVDWTIRIISAVESSADRDKNHDDKFNYMSVPEYLTLQAVRIQQGQEPVDQLTYTWLGTPFLKDGINISVTVAATGTFGKNNGQVKISTKNINTAQFKPGRRKVAW